MNLSQLRLWACAASLMVAGTIFAHAQGNHFGNQPGISIVASTVPANGDVNPYGIVRVAKGSGKLVEGNILISNFNSSANLQGTGTTIVQIAPDGTSSLFAQIDANNLPGPCPGGVGLTTALAVLRTGWVIVGSLPTTDGTSATAQAGCLLVLDNEGTVAETFYGSLINGPWDMTALDSGSSATLFVTNVLNGTRGRQRQRRTRRHRSAAHDQCNTQLAAIPAIHDCRWLRLLRANRSGGARNWADRRWPRRQGRHALRRRQS
jgi:hypothetical protein